MKRVKIGYNYRETGKSMERYDEIVLDMGEYVAAAVMETDGDLNALEIALTGLCQLMGRKFVHGSQEALEIMEDDEA